MAETVLLAITKIGMALRDEAIKAVVAKLSEKVTNLSELPKNLEYIGRELSMMNAVINDLGTTNLNINVVKCWISELRTLARHVEDVMDKYSYHTSQLKEEGSLKFFRGAHYVKVFSEVADEVVKIKVQTEHIRSLKTWFPEGVLIHRNSAGTERRGFQGYLPGLVQDVDLVGTDGRRKEITEWLNSNQPDSTLLTVSGMGGLGKTTLILDICKREKMRFDVHVWLPVSQKYNLHELLKMIKKILDREWQETGKDQAQSNIIEPQNDIGVQDLKEAITRKLDGKKCLLVLDDVWNQEVYYQVCDAFLKLQDIRIIITTRIEDVGNIAPCKHIKLRPLDDFDAFNLFCAVAFRTRMDRTCPTELKEVATSIVRKCKGLPLGIVCLGSMFALKNPTDFGWKQMANQVISDLAKSDDVQEILKLSYNDLPGNLRNCFLYCCLFPEDYIISRESLVRQWVAEGFAVSIENNAPEVVAELNLMELINRNMLQVEEYDELGRVSTCKMHDILRELALYTAKDEKFGSANDQGAMMQLENDVRRLSSCGWKDDDALTMRFPHLRTLMSFEAVTSTQLMLSSILSGSSYLTVLELQDSEITEVPGSICNLFNLRYIGLRRTRIKSLPDSIGKLSNLQTLDIKQTKIEKLPRGIGKIKKLRHLLADREVDENQREFQYFAAVQPPKDLSNMVELQTLETVEATEDLADQLEKLKKLQSVWIGKVSAMYSAKLFATLSRLPLLSSLLLNASDENQKLQLDALNPQSKQLHRLIIRGHLAAGTLKCPIFHCHGKNLKYLALSWSGLQNDPLPLLEQHMPNLAYLSLNRASSADTLVISEGCFPQLKTLVLKNLNNVNLLMIGKGALKNIEGLYIVGLPKLDKVPEDIESLSSLKKLCLLHLHKDFKAQWDRKGMHPKMPYVLELHI